MHPSSFCNIIIKCFILSIYTFFMGPFKTHTPKKRFKANEKNAFSGAQAEFLSNVNDATHSSRNYARLVLRPQCLLMFLVHDKKKLKLSRLSYNSHFHAQYIYIFI